ncbi:MAG: eukaryotic-like serine/threonine-protein kinase, partial [Myxococcales bacterium]|nr:eukaryotic-like serine/threonine-protein kinase [Myxococcales bacterium]
AAPVVPAPALSGYATKRLLGMGGFGAVFEAVRASDGASVAIKVARADQATASERLVLEAEVLATIGPPHVPAVFSSGHFSDGAAYVVMEFIKASIMADRLAALDEPMSLAEFGAAALPILDIIDVVHQHSFIHCDLKPENLFVDDAIGVKLFDFGLVRRQGNSSHESTREEAPAGTAEYMSPEQCEGRVDLDARSDLYALAVIFYEMLAGVPPFFGNPAEVQQSHRSRRPASLARKATIPAALDAAIMRGLAKDRERRFATVAAFKEAVKQGLAAAMPVTVTTSVSGGVAGVDAAGETNVSLPSAGAVAATLPTKAVVKPAAAAPARERRPVALVFFEGASNIAAVREALTSVGAHLAHTAGTQFVAAFGHEVGDNPTRSAAAAAEMFIARDLCKRALVDLASVSIQPRPDGTRRFQSPLFTRKEQYPSASDPEGVLLSAAAAEVLPDVAVDPVPGRTGIVRRRPEAQASERTATRVTMGPPLIGRDELLRTLLEAAREATGTARPTITTLIGEAGYGKTQLAQSLVQNLEAIPRLQTLFIRAKEALGGASDQTMREIFARALQLPTAAPADLGRGLLGERLGLEIAREVWGGVAVAMGWAPPEHPELRLLAAAPGALRSAAARAAGESLRLMARKHPVALVVDDAQFVDEVALDSLEYASLQEAACPIWICVVARPSFGRGRTAWASRAARRQELVLPALEPAAAAELARRLLSPAENVPATALERLAERTQGIPLLLAELVRGLKRDGLVRRSEKGTSWYLATDELDRLPDLPLVQWLASRETESLPPDLLAHARLASLLGAEFTADDLEGVLQELERAGVPTDAQLDASVGLRRLTESGILVRHRRGRVGFRHSLLRDAVYQGLAAGQRDAIHRAAYGYYLRQQTPDDERLPQMAFHAARSGLKEEAGRLYLDLAERALARHKYLDAEMLYRDALGNLPATDDRRQISASKGLGLMRFRLGRYEDSVKDFVAARTLAQKAGVRPAEIEILLDQAVVLDWTQEWPQSAALVEEADQLATGALRTPAVEARLLFGKGRSLHRMERIQEAESFLERAEAVSEKLGDEGYESHTQSLSLLAWGFAALGHFEQSERSFERVLGVFAEHGDMINLAGALGNRCLLWLLTNNTERLLNDYKRSITIARENGFPLLESGAQKDLGEVYYLLGRIEEAEPHVHRSMEMCAQILGPSARPVSIAEMLFARLALYRGDLETARAAVARVLGREEAAIAAGRSENQLSRAERLLLTMVELAVRGAPDEEWDQLLSSTREINMQPQDLVEILEMKGLSALRGGRYQTAVRYLQQAFEEGEKNARLLVERLRGDLDLARTKAAS